MEGAKEFLKKKGIVPNISFQDKKVHIVKLMKSGIKTIKTDEGLKEGLSVTVIEDNQPKRFFTTSESLISKLAEYPEGTTISIQMKSRKTEDGRFVNYYETKIVRSEFVGSEEEVAKEFPKSQIEIPDEAIPVIEEEE